ncbi:unnamed protein product [Aspergillus oryzae]|uniref:Unnamed protein product n=2 Tax=Aspergillus oryzae TaxID=5062 RepID=A0AAN5C1U2_ASPOZ|nr:unnamed protein product [Aspergillus oryzae]GMF87692.1 unnamed protein product [Aspergillus oryzae]GMG09476.1 unnamed protein product [Aspergillus oryzae]GMG34469.1 unnamed protein product [Aspergillus oryzae]GMG46526.1 unnamed protein product [Aspergillus oryzae var. brunneus]
MGAAGPSQYRDSPAATPGGSESVGLPGSAETPIRLKQEPGVARSNPLTSAGRVSIPREEWDNVRTRLKEMEQTINNLRVGLEKAEEGQASSLETGSVQSGDASIRSKAASPEREGIHAANTLGEGTVHLGSRSVLAYILNNKSGSDQLQALLEGGILPKLGLDNESATYPFVDLWSSDMSTFDVSAVCSALPSDQQCKETATGGIYRSDNDQAQKPFGVSIAFLGLLFAVLASGCQSSDLPGKERELTSQVYGECRVPLPSANSFTYWTQYVARTSVFE